MNYQSLARIAFNYKGLGNIHATHVTCKHARNVLGVWNFVDFDEAKTFATTHGGTIVRLNYVNGQGWSNDDEGFDRTTIQDYEGFDMDEIIEFAGVYPGESVARSDKMYYSADSKAIVIGVIFTTEN